MLPGRPDGLIIIITMFFIVGTGVLLFFFFPWQGHALIAGFIGYFLPDYWYVAVGLSLAAAWRANQNTRTISRSSSNWLMMASLVCVVGSYLLYLGGFRHEAWLGSAVMSCAFMMFSGYFVGHSGYQMDSIVKGVGYLGMIICAGAIAANWTLINMARYCKQNTISHTQYASCMNHIEYFAQKALERWQSDGNFKGNFFETGATSPTMNVLSSATSLVITQGSGWDLRLIIIIFIGLNCTALPGLARNVAAEYHLRGQRQRAEAKKDKSLAKDNLITAWELIGQCSLPEVGVAMMSSVSMYVRNSLDAALLMLLIISVVIFTITIFTYSLRPGLERDRANADLVVDSQLKTSDGVPVIGVSHIVRSMSGQMSMSSSAIALGMVAWHLGPQITSSAGPTLFIITTVATYVGTLSQPRSIKWIASLSVSYAFFAIGGLFPAAFFAVGTWITKDYISVNTAPLKAPVGAREVSINV